MNENKVGAIPDFTSDEATQEEVQEESIEEVKEDIASDAPILEEKETPAEPPAESEESEQKPALENESGDIGNLTKQVSGLQSEREKLLRQIVDLKGQRRELKQQEINQVSQQINEVNDELADLHPDDISLIEKVARSKGLLTKSEAQQMFYDVVKKEEINNFLEKFPEYKPENDPDDLNWSALQRQFQWPDGSPRINMPKDPRLISQVLLQAHREIVKTPNDRGTVAVKQQQIKVASSGSTGSQRSSPKPVNSHLSSLLRSHMHGWSEEEIKNLETKLPE